MKTIFMMINEGSLAMDFIVWRHAQADNQTDNLSRQLTLKGQEDAKRMASFLRHKLPENMRFFASEAKRSQETLATLSDDFQVCTQLNPDQAAELVLPFLYGQFSQPLLCVGHQPWLGHICSHLISGQTLAKAPLMSVKRAAFYWFDIKLNPQTGKINSKLKASLNPSLLR